VTGPHPPPLAGLEVAHDPADDPAARHAAGLLDRLGATITTDPARRPTSGLATQDLVVEGCGASDSARDWAASGAMWLTGTADGPPLLPPGSGATAARGALLAFELLSTLGGARVAVPGHRLLGEHAAARGLSRRGPWSPGGRFQLVAAADGLIGVSLGRDADLELVPALVEDARVEDPWLSVTTWAARTPAADAVARAQLLGLPAAAVAEPTEAAADEQAAARGQRFPFEPFVVDGEVLRPGRGRVRAGGRWSARPGRPLVVDLSALWAGPLCAHLLGLAGARVVKVESHTRPDGLRHGVTALYDLLHAGHESVALDFADPADQARLRRLVEEADVVIDASRPRAMAQLGIAPAAVVGGRPDRTWLSITGYGRTGPWANRVGLGDDAAVGAGLAATDPGSRAVVPCGDAVADPLTGAHAAVAVLASVLGGGSRVVDLALREVVGATLGDVARRPIPSPAADRVGDGWILATGDGGVAVEAPQMRSPLESARRPGADTASVLAGLGVP
jgi:crotonobetainyl-CoA:carnitine CoA-transferase CaiB-like acyl-CoA transferase